MHKLHVGAADGLPDAPQPGGTGRGRVAGQPGRVERADRGTDEQVGRDARCPNGAGVLRKAGADACRDPKTGAPVTGAGGGIGGEGGDGGGDTSVFDGCAVYFGVAAGSGEDVRRRFFVDVQAQEVRGGMREVMADELLIGVLILGAPLDDAQLLQFLT